MKKILKSHILASALFCSLQFISGPTLANPLSITLDTGHTFNNYGSMGATGITEYQYNVALTNKIHFLLNKLGVEVKRVPETQKLIDRTTYAPNTNLFVSIHHDAFPSILANETNRTKGFSIFVSKKNPYYKESLSCAKKVAKSLIDSGEIRSAYHEMSIKGENKTLLDNIGVYQYDNLVVLKNSPQPAILIEAGVITREDEATRLANSDVQKDLAIAITLGLKECIK